MSILKKNIIQIGNKIMEEENKYIETIDRTNLSKYKNFVSGELGFFERIHRNILMYYEGDVFERHSAIKSLYLELIPHCSSDLAELENLIPSMFPLAVHHSKLPYITRSSIKELLMPLFEMELSILKKLFYHCNNKGFIRSTHTSQQVTTLSFISGDTGFQERINQYLIGFSEVNLMTQSRALKILYIELSYYLSSDKQEEMELKLKEFIEYLYLYVGKVRTYNDKETTHYRKLMLQLSQDLMRVIYDQKLIFNNKNERRNN